MSINIRTANTGEIRQIFFLWGNNYLQVSDFYIYIYINQISTQ